MKQVIERELSYAKMFLLHALKARSASTSRCFNSDGYYERPKSYRACLADLIKMREQ